MALLTSNNTMQIRFHINGTKEWEKTKHGTCTIYIDCSLCISFSVFCTVCLWGQMCLSTTTAGNVCLFDFVYLILKTVSSVDLLDPFCMWSTAFVVVVLFCFLKVPPSSIVFAQSLTCGFFFYSFWLFWSFTSNCTESRLKSAFWKKKSKSFDADFISYKEPQGRRGGVERQ